MTRYVLGFLFSLMAPTRVVLIRKNKPDWQKGLLNGIGGKVEEGESTEDAMVREFQEETGVIVTAWRSYCALCGDDFRVDVFKAFDSSAVANVRSVSGEPIITVFPHAVLDPNPQPQHRSISNIPWLIAMAMDGNHREFHATVNYPKS